MGSSSGVGGGSSSSSSSNSCCDVSMKCWCRWRLNQFSFSKSSFFILTSFLLFVFLVSIYARLAIAPYSRTPVSVGCQEDNEGSWSIGVYYGDSPFNLKPIESRNEWKDECSAWPVANPVITCASVSNAGFPSNFVSEPFLFLKGDILYMFYETKNSITLQGDIAVAKSTDKGVTWEQLGIALDEGYHLSHPYVFNYNDEIYMIPETSYKGELRLYKAVDFPLKWTLEKVIMKKAFMNTVIINYGGNFWLFGSYYSGFGFLKNVQQEIWYSSSPLGPWKPHRQNPIYNTGKSFGVLRNGGRPFVYHGNLYRVAQDCGKIYGQRVRTFKVEILTKDEYREVEVPLGIEEPKKGRNAWNGARYHHLDVQDLGSGEWIGVMDGDRTLAGDSVHRCIVGSTAVSVVLALFVLVGVLLGPVNCILPRCFHATSKRNDAFLRWEDYPNLFSSKMRWLYTRVNMASSFMRGWVKPSTCMGKLVLVLIFVLGVVLMCTGVRYIYGGNGAEEPYLWKDQYSQFTLLTMTYEARLWNLKMCVKHYSRCPSVKEIVVVWNKGNPPELGDFDTVVPVRIRVEKQNSLNNRFRVDPLITTKAVLELDDDIMMSCDDIERGFRVWREHPNRIVGFYPRLVAGSPLRYRNERFARKRKGYNMILTGAAFIDRTKAFETYWGEEAKEGREIVDKFFNCEDVLLNFLYANSSSSSQAVEYVKPSWVVDMSKFSGVAISGNTQVHENIRSDCIAKFTEIYGSIDNWKWDFDSRKDGWDA
ncbi:hypothetical protein MKW98_019875 [Papaver atlanticum]|uniref:Glucosamine inositolphosphorylceramide transferase 1 n=1 Tax=Papaver atlanticum TaxID=357466 RepID=A0AAD4S2E9_9MAGN|nr:hypothetical protein MKW98_019875 [Papaver atlanticum]